LVLSRNTVRVGELARDKFKITINPKKVCARSINILFIYRVRIRKQVYDKFILLFISNLGKELILGAIKLGLSYLLYFIYLIYLIIIIIRNIVD